MMPQTVVVQSGKAARTAVCFIMKVFHSPIQLRSLFIANLKISLRNNRCAMSLTASWTPEKDINSRISKD